MGIICKIFGHKIPVKNASMLHDYDTYLCLTCGQRLFTDFSPWGSEEKFLEAREEYRERLRKSYFGVDNEKIK